MRRPIYYSSLFILIISSVLVSCATSKSKSALTQQMIDDEYAYIKNSDFVAPKEVKYEEQQDQFVGELPENDTLTKESIARLPAPKLQQVAAGPDPVSTGISLCYQKRFDDAFKLFDSIYAKYKSHPSYWNQIGSCYYLQNNLRKALLFYNKARDINNNYAPAINNIGVIYLKQGKEQKALVAFKKASEVNAFSLTPVFNLAQLYLKYGFIDEAQKMFNSLAKQKQGDPDVLSGLGNLALLRGDLGSSIQYYSQIEEVFGSRPHIGLNYAVALKIAGKTAEAQAVYKKVDTRDLGSMRAYYKKVASFIGM